MKTRSTTWMFIVGLALVWLGGSPSKLTAVTPTATQLGKQIGEFALRDFRGRERTLREFDGKPVAVVFVGTDCPLAKLYAPRLEELYRRFKHQGVGVVAINSNTQDTMQKVGAYARIHDLTFPVLKDPDNAVADLFAAERTPHVFLLDAGRIVRYVGRIDDQYGLGETSGYAKSQLHESYLADAIEDLLAGRPVRLAHTEPTGCIIGRAPKVEPHGDITYCNQISRILNNRCVSCHRPGEVAPFPLTSYDEANGWSEMMLEVIDEGRMPPWFANPEHGEFENDCRMPAGEKEMIHKWVDRGCPKGDPSNLPAPPAFHEGWGIDEPDEIIYMSDKPYQVPAEGVVQYKYFTVDPGWKEGRWIKMSESRPGNPSVVHHIVVFIRPPDYQGNIGSGGILSAFSPGSSPTTYPEGVAGWVPAGSKLVFELHYTPNGTPQQDHSRVGVVFADNDEVERYADGGLVGNWTFAIPPYDPNYRLSGDYVFDKDQYLTEFNPHMHLRGKSFRYSAIYPDGREEILLDVPNYDFNWQLKYKLLKPKLMPKGSILRAVAHYDNSADNLANPDPTETVRYGDQTWEEMMHGFFSSIPVETLAERDARWAREAEQP